MIDVNVLAGADIRRIDGKFGKISKVSLPWVSVRWSDGKEESFLRSDAAISEDIELKTLDRGWISLGEVVGTVEESTEAPPKDGLRAALDELRSLRGEASPAETLREKLISEAKKKTAAKKASGGGKGDSPNNPFQHKGGTYSTLGTHTNPVLGQNVKRKKKNIWKCSGTEDSQVCVAQKDVKAQGIKKGTKKTITKWAKKAKYTAKYEKDRATGKSKTPDGEHKPVTHPKFVPSGALSDGEARELYAKSVKKKKKPAKK